MAHETIFFRLPAELRHQIYAYTCPCLYSKEEFCNPVLTRRLSRLAEFHCYKCPGEVLLHVCKQIRGDFSPVFFGVHEFRFQLWMEHKGTLDAWFETLAEDAVYHIRRFRLHTQVPDVSVDLARHPGTGSAMPGYIAVDLDAPLDSQIAISSKNWAQDLLEESRKLVLVEATSLPRVDGKLRLTKDALLQMISIVGWFGSRNDRERRMIVQQDEAKRLSGLGRGKQA